MIKNKIMVVEDESIVAEHIRKSLENMGHSVTSVASSGEKAIKDAKDKTPDLVLMDIVLDGELDGIETAKLIRSLFNIPVVFLTAYSDEKSWKGQRSQSLSDILLNHSMTQIYVL